MSVEAALGAFLERGAGGWGDLAFFRDGRARAVAQRVDARIAAGAHVLPEPSRVFAALEATPREGVKAVILGQDPYPTPGDAHGLAFSYLGSRRIPASLRAILAEMAENVGAPAPREGDLTPWAREGVLLLNTALTTEAGSAGAHLKFGWDGLADDALAALSESESPCVFMLWGAPARARAALIDGERHLVLACGHPSPLNRARDFRGCRHFARANAWLAARGVAPIDWRL
ncbi:MAG: uracil-DNA glycosylase [Salinarimonadaceae bacterium]|nr:MAG: uracil-DNA glycosylase [Salinarimonadaceae bacterium]